MIALVQCGDDAMEPLLDCFDHDSRLTRSVGFGRDFSPYRSVESVHDAAFAAISGILQTSYFPSGSAAEIRAYWKKFKGLPADERWFRILADDECTYEQWMQAMTNISRPVDVRISPGTLFGCGTFTMPNRKPGEKPKLSGDHLRLKQDPSLADLVARRVEQMNQWDIGNSNHGDRAASAADMAIALSDLEPVEALPILRKQLNYCVGLFSESFEAEYGEPMLPKVASMASAMAEAGDRSGLKTYGDWLRTKVRPAGIGAEPEDVLAPLWKFQDDPAILDTAEQMFNGPSGDWNPLLPHVNTGWGQEDLLRSPLLGIKSFHDQMLRGLSDQTPYGTITIGANHEIETKEDNSSGKTTVASGETHIAPVGSVMQLRICDKYAYQISLLQGAPEIQDYWPQADRDMAVKGCGSFLNTYAERLRYNDKFQVEDDFPIKQAYHLTFPLLNHSASIAEANSRTAIFSLENQGERRLFKLPAIPMKATWVTLKKYPYDQQGFDTVKNQSIISHVFQQDCYVWQAEELMVNGVWQRYYGVVGPHEVEKVPAAEIEFPMKWWDWPPLGGGTDCSLHLTGESEDVTHVSLPVGKPITIHLLLRNRRGVPQELPAHLTANLKDGKLAVHAGINITVHHMSDEPDPRRAEGPDAGILLDEKPLSDLPSERSNEKKLVESADSYEAASLDLRDCFDLTRPGRYRVRINFTKQSGLGEGSTQQIDFQLK